MLALLKTLLGSIVDYAGLYPPAQLELRSAMQHYDRHAATPDAWMLSRFVLPAARLAELSAILPELPLAQWPLSVVVKSCQEVEQALALESNRLKIAALEFTPQPPDELHSLVAQLPSGIDVFVEIPLDSPQEETASHRSIGDTIAILHGTRAFAKVRTGGMTASAFPSRRLLAEWIDACAQAKIPFKATAGLHHPFPGSYRITYESDSPMGRMHGFLNVAIAAAFAYSQAVGVDNIMELLEMSSFAEHLQIQNDRLLWHSQQGIRHLGLAEIQTARQQFFRSFGSCSFQEPIDDLRKLGLID